MNLRKLAFSVFVGGSLLGATCVALRAEEIEAVSSRAAADYVRGRAADGSFLPENYVFGPGGYWSGGVADPSIDQMKFLDVAHVIAAPLASQNYLPSPDPRATKLLIMVYWGTTNPPDRQNSSAAFQNAVTAMNALQASKYAAGAGTPSASNSIQHARGSASGSPEEENAANAAIALIQAENQRRRRQDIATSKLLGYDSWWSATAHLEGTPLDGRRNDMLNELEEDRYFVVLMAYDFQLMWKQKQSKLLWETRFSVSERHHKFDEILPTMARYAAKYFGQDSRGLQHSEVPIGKVEVGELKSLGTVDSPERTTK